MLGKQRTWSKLLIPESSWYLTAFVFRRRGGKAWSYDSAVVFSGFGVLFSSCRFCGFFCFSLFKSECLHCTCGLEGLGNVLLPVSTREMWCWMRKSLGLSDMGCWGCFAAFPVCLSVGELGSPRLAHGHRVWSLTALALVTSINHPLLFRKNFDFIIMRDTSAWVISVWRF